MPLSRVTRDTRDNRKEGFLTGVARLAPGVTEGMARAELAVLGQGLRERYPEESGDKAWGLAPLLGQTVGDIRGTLGPLFGAVALLLVIACVNVANLMLVRSSERSREFALRTAIGAGRRRLVRQVLAESTLVGVLGGATGLVLAVFGLRAFVALNPGDIPRLSEVRMDGSVLAFSFVATLVVSVVIGLAPARFGSRRDLSDVLREGPATSGASRRQARLRGGFVVAQTGLALVLVIGAGLLVGSFVRMNRVDFGFDPSGVYVMNLTYPAAADSDEASAFFTQLITQLESIPEIESAAATAIIPGGGFGMYQRPVFDADFTVDPDGTSMKYQQVSGSYFASLGIPLIRGRTFDARDHAGSELVAVINETAARTVFGDAEPLGRTFSLDEDGVVEGTFTIVGVVGDARIRGVRSDPEPELFLAHVQAPRRFMDVLVKAQPGNAALLETMQQEVWKIRPELPVLRRTELTRYISGSIAPERFYTALLSGFAGVALLLALVGIYGTLTYSVSQRTREVGVRMAVGASAASVRGMIVRQGLLLGGLGLIIGVAASLPLTRFLEALVFGIAPSDPVTIAAASALLLVTIALASLAPALRATRVDVSQVLRDD